jgi:uncharacterized membrane protein YvbJ
MNCKNCGYLIGDGFGFCPKCGSPRPVTLGGQVAADSSLDFITSDKKQKNKKRFLPVAAGVVALI